MGHSFTTYKNKHIRSKDFKIEVWLFLLVEKSSSLTREYGWLTEAIENWKETAENPINGCMDPEFERFLTDTDKEEAFIELCSSIIEDLESFGEYVPKAYINKLCAYKPPYDVKVDNDTELYLSYGRRLVALISGNQQEKTVHV